MFKYKPWSWFWEWTSWFWKGMYWFNVVIGVLLVVYLFITAIRGTL